MLKRVFMSLFNMMPGKCLTGFELQVLGAEFWRDQNSYKRSNILTRLLKDLIVIDANALT